AQGPAGGGPRAPAARDAEAGGDPAARRGGVSAAAGPDAERAFTRLYEEHRPAIHAFLLGRAGDPETARDLLQETFLRVWRSLHAVLDLPAERRRSWIFAV